MRSSFRLPVSKLNTRTKELTLGDAKVYHMPDWSKLTHPQRLGIIRKIAMMRGRDPVIAKFVIGILRKAGVKPRDYAGQAAALLKWVQDPKNVYYANEPGERLQDPIVTLKLGFGDCDDTVLLLCTFFESINLPWKLCLSGRHQGTGDKVRFIEGEAVPTDVKWSHIYCMVGTPPFSPNLWYFCETTIIGVPLGWDVVAGDPGYLPEMRQPGGPASIAEIPPVPLGFRPGPLPSARRRSPAYAMAYGDVYGNGASSALGPAIGAAVAAEMDEDEGQNSKGFDWKNFAVAIGTGVAVSVGTQMTLDWLRGNGLFEDGGLPKLLRRDSS